MPTVTDFPAGRMFEYTIKMAPLAQQDRPFVCSWKAISITAGTLTDIIALGRVLATFHKHIATTLVWFEQWSCRTAAHDSDPYNPPSFYTEPIGEAGEWVRGGATQLLDFDAALRLVKRTAVGNNGALVVRGMLAEEDVQAPAGKWELNNIAVILAKLNEGLDVNTNLRQILQGTAAVALRPCLYGPNGEYPRFVTDVEIDGVSIVKRNHRFYNINEPQAPALVPDVPDIETIMAWNPETTPPTWGDDNEVYDLGE